MLLSSPFALLLLLVVVGVALAFFPMDATIKKLVLAIAVILVVVWLFSFFGLLPIR